jgi:hypothetical protein
MTEQKIPPASGESLFSGGLDDTVRYWLCCGSTVYPHGEKTCYEAKMGHPEHVRYGTVKDHSEWQNRLSSNV